MKYVDKWLIVVGFEWSLRFPLAITRCTDEMSCYFGPLRALRMRFHAC
jgi:hypothetical protein